MKIFLKKLYFAVEGVLIEVGFTIVIMGIAFLLCLFVAWVVR